MDNITFNQRKLHRVLIGQVRPNDWNPKKDDTEEAEKVKLSIQENGQRIPIVVRENEGRDSDGNVTLYQIVDGEQRYRACKALGFPEILIYNEGEMEDNAAKALTIWYQQQVPFDKVLEAELVMAISNMPLPYTLAELADMKEIVNFDWTQVEADALEDVEFRTLTLRLLKDAYTVVIAAIDRARASAENTTMERALELICADYLSS
jgi:hypothetical protein